MTLVHLVLKRLQYLLVAVFYIAATVILAAFVTELAKNSRPPYTKLPWHYETLKEEENEYGPTRPFKMNKYEENNFDDSRNTEVMTLEVKDELNSNYVDIQELFLCKSLKLEPKTRKIDHMWGLLNYMTGSKVPKCDETMTVTTHCSTFDLVDKLPELAERWQAPISIVVATHPMLVVNTIENIFYLRKCLNETSINILKHVSFSLMFDANSLNRSWTIPSYRRMKSLDYPCSRGEPRVPLSQSEDKRNYTLYPVSVARAFAKQAAVTQFILPIDIDMLPSQNLERKFMRFRADIISVFPTFKTNTVFPVFLFDVMRDEKLPLTKAELNALITSSKAKLSDNSRCIDCNGIEKWISTQAHDVTVYKSFGHETDDPWRPNYITMKRASMLDIDFVLWDSLNTDKFHLYLMCLKKTEFAILSEVFLVQRVAEVSTREKFANFYRRKLDEGQTELIDEMVGELADKYGAKMGQEMGDMCQF